MNWYKRANIQIEEIPEEIENNTEVEFQQNYPIQPKEESKLWEYDEDTAIDYYNNHDSFLFEQAQAFNNSVPGEQQPWRVAPLSRVKKIWRDYMTLGFVRDVKGIEKISEIVIENIQKIHANTILMGHTGVNYEALLEEMGTELQESDSYDYGDWIRDERGQWRISDYAISELVNYGMELMNASSPEEKLQKLDRIFNIVHRRSDIASWFIEKGKEGLNEIFNQ